jgi:hypothetical protein
MEQISLPDVILKPLGFIPWCQGADFTQAYHHDHMTTGWAVGLVCAVLKRFSFWVALAVFILAFAYHVLFKELWLDRFKNAGPGGGKQRAIDLTTRAWGFLHASLWFAS